MDTYFVKDIDAFTFCFHPEKSHIYYLTEANDLNKQYIIEEDLLTFNVINKFEVLEDQAKASDPYGYSLYFYKKKQYLVLTYPSSLITIWDTNSKALLFKSYVLKKPAEKITALALSETYPQMVFAMKNQIRLFVTNINEAITAESSVNFRKLKLPKKVVVNDIKCHPVEAKCAVACSDGFIRTWDLTGLNAMASIVDLSGAKRAEALKMSDTSKLGLPSIVCISFSQDGTKLLSCNDTGRITCWDVTNFGEDYVALANIRVSEKGILSSTWINYNGDYRSTKLLCYTQEGNIKLLELERKAEKRPDKRGVVWSFTELENIYHAKGGVYPEKLDIEPNYPNFIKTHPFSNLILVNTLKEKKLLKQRTVQSKFSLSLKVLIIFDKMDHLLDYPKIAPSIYAPLNQVLFQPNQKSLKYLKDLFFVEDATLNHLNLSNGKKEIVIEFLKTPQLSDVVRTTRFELRPISSDYVPQYTFLMNFQKEKFHVLLIATYNQETDPASFKLYKEIPCMMSLFLGNTHLSNPPVYILGEDGMSYQLFIDDPSRLDDETRQSINVEAGVRDSLNAKIKKVYWTPFRNGYVVLYQTSYDNLLRFSMNRLPQNDILDFKVLTTDYVFKGQYDEDVFDVIWQTKSGLIPGEQYLGAVISWNKITIINENLQAITSIKIPYFNIRTNMLVNAFWFGYTLFYYTKNHLFYSTVNGKSNCLFCFDNYSNKNQILAVMNDRVVFGSKPNILNSKQAKQPKYKMEIRFRPLILTEPILLGYLSLNKIYPDFQPDWNVVKHNFLTLETSNLSSELLKAFNEHQLFNASWFVLANQNNLQFSLEEKIKVLNKLGQFDKFFEILFPGKYLNDEADVNELIFGILNNPIFYVEKKLLQKQAEVFINFGEFKKAVHCYDLLQEYQKISGLLIAIQEKKAIQDFTSKFLRENDTRIWNYNLKAALLIQAQMIDELMRLREQLRTGTYIEKCDFKITPHKSYGTTINFEVNDLKLIMALRNLSGREMGAEEDGLYNKVRQRYKIDADSMEPISKLGTQFGESAYSFSYAIRPTADEEEKLKSRFSEIYSMTPYQFLGYNCLEADETKKKVDEYGYGGGGMEGYDENEADELGAIIIYWRCDEGKGAALENILGNNLNGTIEFKSGNASDEIWTPLEDGDPIELEDKWGKKCPPQFAINFKQDYNSVKCPKKNWYPGSLSKFTVELWLRPNSENGLILEIGQGNFVVAFQNSELALQMKGSSISLTSESNQNMHKDEMDDDESVADRAADEEANKIKREFWNHVSIVYDNSQQKKILVYLNCVLIGSSETNLPNDLFRDQILCLGKEKLNAELTEFRFWTSALSLSELKEQYRMPLEIVYEKKKEIKVKFKAINKNGLGAPPSNGLPIPGLSLPEPGAGGGFGLPAPGIGLPEPSGGFGLPPPGMGLPNPEQTSFKPMLPSPGDFQSFSTSKEERSPDKRHSVTRDSYTKESRYDYEERDRYQSQNEDESNKKQDFTNFSNFEAPSRSENQSTSNFNQFSNFGEEVKNEENSEQPAPSDFATFSDFNTVKPSSGFDTFTSAPEGKFEDFKQWESTNTTSAAAATDQGGQSDFAGFASFSQPVENVQEKKEGFGDFGGFDSFQDNSRKSEVKNDNFAQFNSFEQKPDSTPKSSIQNYGGRSSLEGSEDKKRQFDTGDHSVSDHHNFEMSYQGGAAGSVEDLSFSQGGNLGENPNVTQNEDMIQSRLSRSKSMDPAKFDYVDTIFKELTAYEVLDKNEVANAKDAWMKILDNFYRVETAATIEAIYDGINLIRKQCLNTSKLGDKALLRKLQKLIILVGKFRLATQILAGIQDIKQRENPSLRKLCFLCITLYSLRLNHALNPSVLIEMGELNTKAKNYKIAKQIFATLGRPGFDLTEDQIEKINEKNNILETMPDENQTLNKMTCPYCSQIFGFTGEYSCPHCFKEFALCYQTMVPIDEESNIKCNACHATFSKTAKKPNEKCSVCSTGVLCIKK